MIRPIRAALALLIAVASCAACHVPGERPPADDPAEIALAMIGCAGPVPDESALDRLVDPRLLETQRTALLDALATIDPAGTPTVVDVVALEGLGRAAVELELALPGGGVARYDLDLGRGSGAGWRVRWLRGPGTEWPPPRRRAGGGLTSSQPDAVAPGSGRSIDTL